MPTPITLSPAQLEEAEMTLRALAHFTGGWTAVLYVLAADCLASDRMDMIVEARIAAMDEKMV